MAALTTTANSDFTPAVGDFNVQSTGGPAQLVRKNAAGAAFAFVGQIDAGAAVIVSNPIAGAIYQLQATAASTVRADQ